jgi:hypothetical protein
MSQRLSARIASPNRISDSSWKRNEIAERSLAPTAMMMLVGA